MDTSDVQIFKKIVKIAFGSIFALIIVFGSFVTVATGKMGVKTRLGKVVGTMEPGAHMKLPLIESVTKIQVNNRVVKNEHYANEKGEVISDNALAAASKDLQTVQASSVVSYNIDPSKIIEIYSQYRTAENYEEAVVKPIIKQVIKGKTAEYTAEELVTKRTALNDSVTETLRDQLSTRYAIFQNSSVTNIEFSPSFNQAIEAKVTAEQNALAAKNKLAQTEYEGQQKIVSAQAEAEAIKIQSQAINSQGGRDYVNLKAIEKWDGSLPTQMIPGSTVPFINLTR